MLNPKGPEVAEDACLKKKKRKKKRVEALMNRMVQVDDAYWRKELSEVQ